MLMDEYFSAMKAVLMKAEQTQRETILAAAEEIANRQSPRQRRLRTGWKKAARGTSWTRVIC